MTPFKVALLNFVNCVVEYFWWILLKQNIKVNCETSNRIFAFVLSADALKCYECIPEQAGEACTKQTECSSDQQCASIREVNYEGL